jgi:hypothetical protein
MTQLATILAVAATLSGCGLAETGAAAAAGGASQVQQAREAKQTEARVQKQLDAAYQQNAEHLHAAENEPQ